MAAGRAMLDKNHPALPSRLGDTNSYLLGSICGHNVVMVCLPLGDIGTNFAASVVTQLRSSFQKFQYGLIVGIGGGMPSRKFDIRLGDVVVSRPVDKYPGVVQYDFGKAARGGNSEQTGTLNRPPDVLLGSISSLEAQYSNMDNPISSMVKEQMGLRMTSYGFPGQVRDELFESSYAHPEFEDDCSECDRSRLVKREPRLTDEPYIWYGLLASGNQVMKDGPTRDALSECSSILCFEMEAAGIMNYLPCLVIRGICDYCDSHKKKKWKGYPAMTAAAYAELLLSIVPKHSLFGKDVKTNKTSRLKESNACNIFT
ncbi:purine and uridine phosphorylase [Aspergillus californicus]